MRLVIISEKPSLGKIVVESCARHGLSGDDEINLLTIHPYNSLGSSFRFPRGRAYAQFPLIAEAEYKPIEELQVRQSHFWGTFTAEGTRVYRRSPARSENAIMRHAERVIVCFDDHSTGYHGSLRAVDWFRRFNPHVECEWIAFRSPREADIDMALAQPFRRPIAEERAVPSLIKRHFDYNFHLNAQPILRRTFDAVGVASDAEIPSKLAVQLLYSLRDAVRGYTDTTLIQAMEKWTGTGKYPRAPRSSFGEMGSPASRGSIIETLVKTGLISRTGEERVKRLAISELGRRFLDALHPDCEDRDLTFRIERWQGLPMEEAVPKIDRYIRTWFGKQKRFLEKKERPSFEIARLRRRVYGRSETPAATEH